MNKIVKLPLFLGAVVGVCGAILGAVNSFTAPKIAQAKKEKAGEAYVAMFKDFNATKSDFDIDSDFDAVDGCTVRATYTKNGCKGACYTCTATGFGGKIEFQVAFANGKYLGYNDLGNSETGGFGADLIKTFGSIIKNIGADEKLLENSTYTTAQAGKSVTGKALANQIEKCRVDYMAWYNA